jgi:hypothetical protein
MTSGDGRSFLSAPFFSHGFVCLARDKRRNRAPHPRARWAGGGATRGKLTRSRPPHQKRGAACCRVVQSPSPKRAARSRLIIGDFGPSDSALAAARGGRLRRPTAERHAARCASRDLCSGGAPRRYPPSGVDGGVEGRDAARGGGERPARGLLSCVHFASPRSRISHLREKNSRPYTLACGWQSI